MSLSGFLMSSSCSQSPFIYRPKVDTSLPSWRDPAAKEGMRRLLLEATIRLTCTFAISAARIRSLVPTYSIAPKLAFDILSRLKQGRNLNSLIPKGSLLYRKTVTCEERTDSELLYLLLVFFEFLKFPSDWFSYHKIGIGQPI